jgi:predicted transcriptional regulator
MSKVLQCNCDDDLAAWAERIAKALNMSVSTLQRVALTAFRQQHEQQVQNAADSEKLLKFLQGIPSIASVSTRGDK